MSTKPGTQNDTNKIRWGAGRVFYGIAVVYVASAYIYDLYILEYIKNLPNGHNILERLGATRYGGRIKYLTQINMKIQTIFYITAFVVYLFKLDRIKETLNFMFKAVVFPLASLVCIMFWGLYAIDRDVIYPKLYDEVVPVLLNHMWHTFILPLPILDALIVSRNQNNLGSSYWALLIQFILSASYVGWVLWIKYYGNFWVYPFMALMTPVQFGLFILFNFFLIIIFAEAGHFILKIRWGERLKVKNI